MPAMFFKRVEIRGSERRAQQINIGIKITYETWIAH